MLPLLRIREAIGTKSDILAFLQRRFRLGIHQTINANGSYFAEGQENFLEPETRTCDAAPMI
jgi:hypothetical protein